MARPSIADLTASAASSDGPFFVPPIAFKFGGVDPLGLRQINFDLMDQVLPGLNNVARHVRPFVVVSWAWHRAIYIAKTQGPERIKVDDILDFVDRIDVLFVWSQFLRDPNADLPGRQVLDQLVRSDRWVFGGSEWRNRRKTRRYSTALMAPINYGPALKTLGWVEPHRDYPGLFLPSATAAPAIIALEAQLSEYLDAAAFTRFGEVEVPAAEVSAWSEAWALDEPSGPEQQTMAGMLLGDKAPTARRKGCALMLAAAANVSKASIDDIRAAMAGTPSNFVPPAGLEPTQAAWRDVQVRQLFRLALEALFYWAAYELKDAPKTTDGLVSRFLDQYAGNGARDVAIEWFASHAAAGGGPTELLSRIQAALSDPSLALVAAIVDGLKLCLSEAAERSTDFARTDRLPLIRARRDAEAWIAGSTRDFLRNVFETWIFAQHVYWSVGRGLADARVRGKTILRLKVVLEENGWSLAPGVSNLSQPSPTADRLQTALTLAGECSLTNYVDSDT